MRLLEFLILVVLFIALLGGIYLLWNLFPAEPVEFEDYRANISQEFPLKSAQFYPNMRFQSDTITYSLSENCSAGKQKDFRKAADILEEKTILKFRESFNPEINVTCSNVAPTPDEEGHFVAGEGGPTIILNSSEYAVILSARIALYRSETCQEPQIALHEILHALGFEHNSNQNSIMYPLTDCRQILDESIIEDINSLYSQPSLADLIVESIKANKTGRYLNFEITVGNYGLKEVKNSSLNLIIGGSIIKSFFIGNFEVGAKRSLSVSNLLIPSDAQEIYFGIETTEPEISKENNRVKISVTQTQK